MKPIRFNKTFEKNYKKRVLADPKLSKLFDICYEAFASGQRDYPLNDHALKGKLKGKRAFSVANDIRIVYEETDDAFIFLDIGSHNQVYN